MAVFRGRRRRRLDCRLVGQSVGPTGHVLVTDIDPHFLTSPAILDQPNLEVQRHNIGADPLPQQTFDLIHARLVLIHVPTRQQALTRMVAALKPGGWIVIEDFDAPIDRSFPTKDAASAALIRKFFAALAQLQSVRGGEIGWGRKLYGYFLEEGLVEVGMEGHLAIWRGLHLDHA